MRGFLSVVSVLALSACAGIVVPVLPPVGDIAPDPVIAAMLPCAAPGNQAAVEQATLARINALRAEKGIGALQTDPRLTRAAQRQACDNARAESIAHRGADGSDLTTRLRREGFGPWRAAENTALISPGQDDTLTLWMGSGPHRANILLASVSSAGIGRAVSPSGREAWVLVVGRGR